MNMKKLIFAVLLNILPMTAMASVAGGVDMSAMLSAWGTRTDFTTCKTNYTGYDWCVGQSASSDCQSWTNVAHKSGGKRNQYATLAMVAHKINRNGGYFCITQLEGAHGHKDRSWTEYYYPNNGTGTACTWLCRDGYKGTDCATADDGSVCSATTISRNSYSNYKINASESSSIEILLSPTNTAIF